LVAKPFKALPQETVEEADTLKVTVEYLEHIRSVARNKRSEEVELKRDATVSELLENLTEKYGRPFRETLYRLDAKNVRADIIILVNGQIPREPNETILESGDNIKIMPTISGG